jgi:hypothetical protein
MSGFLGADGSKMTERGKRGGWTRIWWTPPRSLRPTRLYEWIIAKTSANLDQETMLSLTEDALATQIRMFGADSAPTANGRSAVARQLEKMGRLTEARVLREEVFAAYVRNRGPEDWDTVDAEEALAQNLIRSAMPTDARPLAEHVHNARVRDLGPDHELTRRAESWIQRIDRADEDGQV